MCYSHYLESKGNYCYTKHLNIFHSMIVFYFSQRLKIGPEKTRIIRQRITAIKIHLISGDLCPLQTFHTYLLHQSIHFFTQAKHAFSSHDQKRQAVDTCNYILLSYQLPLWNTSLWLTAHLLILICYQFAFPSVLLHHIGFWSLQHRMNSLMGLLQIAALFQG